MSHSLLGRRRFLQTVGLGAGAFALRTSGGRAQAVTRPNIVVMMADDMGFSDLGCYGGEIWTPNLDGLAGEGVRFTQFYNTARCCPTRASLLTGLYAHQAGVGYMVGDSGYDGYRGDLNRRCVTFAEALRPAGYRTYMSGKWHVTRDTAPDGPKDNWPLQRGFDRYFGTLVGAGSYWKPNALTRDNEPIAPEGEGFYYTDALSDNAAQFVRDHAASHADSPFCLYVAYTSPHWPLHAPKADVDRYRGTYLQGWDALREERHARMIEMGLVRREWPLTPRDPAATAWEDVPADKREEMDWRMAIYAAQIDRMDQGVGRIVAALQETAQLDNTLLLFLADNGGCAEGGAWGFERKEGGVLGENSSHASYGLSWANASNTPFRLYKHWVHEGGIASPLIAHWPEGIKAQGELRHQPGHVIDIMATCLEVAGAEYPTEHAGEAITPLEGKSLVPAFSKRAIDREALYWEHEGNRAVRRGKWKLVSRHPEGWELYDLEADRTELTNLAERHPQLVEELSALYAAWAERCGVLPWPLKKPQVGSDKREFALKQSDALAPSDSPRVVQESVLITAAIAPTGPNGVIVAQGGSRVGYALYLKDGRLALIVRHTPGGEPTTVSSATALSAGETVVSAYLGKDGAIRLTVDGGEVASGKAPGPIDDMPTEGLEVGSDQGGVVGGYEGPNEFAGTISSVLIKLGE